MIDTYEIQIKWIQKIHGALRSPLMDRFFIGWSYVDSFAFAFIVIALVWYLVGRNLGAKLFYVMALSAVINLMLKKAFGLPRPCQIDPSVGILCLKSFGFPSGAAQTAVLLGGIAVLECRKKSYKVLGILFALFLSFSRIYLGVHFFTDILGGWVVGAVLLLVYRFVFPKMENGWRIWVFLFPILLFLIVQGLMDEVWLSLGVGIGLLLPVRPMEKWFFRIAQSWTVIFGAFFFFALEKAFPIYRPLFAIGLGFWMSFLGGWLIQKARNL